MAVTRFVAPGPLVRHAHAGLAGGAGVALGGEAAALLVAGQDGADLGLGERLVDLHARAAGVGEDDFDAVAFEGLDEDVAAQHHRRRLPCRGWAAEVAVSLIGRCQRCSCVFSELWAGTASVFLATKNPRPLPAVGLVVSVLTQQRSPQRHRHRLRGLLRVVRQTALAGS
jgi:hypothetical protein